MILHYKPGFETLKINVKFRMIVIIRYKSEKKVRIWRINVKFRKI